MSSDEVALSVPAGPGQAEAEAEFKWTAGNAALSVFLFVASGLLEVGGGWLVWQAVREKRPWYFGLGGVAALAGYGFVPCAQPMPDFGRIYAIYGGFFILLSFLWGWLLDGIKVSREERRVGRGSLTDALGGRRPHQMDIGDWVGSAVALAGVLVIMFWPR